MTVHQFLSAFYTRLSNILTTKGDILTFDTTETRLPVGNNDQVLTANSAVDKGIEWSAISIDSLAGGTDGELITWDSGGAATTLAVGTIRQILETQGAGAEPKWVTKSVFASVTKAVDETVNNSETLQDDDEIVLAVQASKTYFGFFTAIFNSSAVADIKMAFVVPSGATCIRQSSGLGAQVRTFTNNFENATSFSTSATNESFMLILKIVVDTTAGNIQLQFAQNTAEVSDTKMLKGTVHYTHFNLN